MAGLVSDIVSDSGARIIRHGKFQGHSRRRQPAVGRGVGVAMLGSPSDTPEADYRAAMLTSEKPITPRSHTIMS